MIENKLKYFTNLDGLRGIAAFSVLIFHFFENPYLTTDVLHIDSVRKITEVLQHGVTLFFVLSGFVITRILLNSKSSEKYFYTFYKRRILRIFPLYYLYLIVFYYVYPYIQFGQINMDFSQQLPVYLYLQNMGWLTGLESNGPGHFWSLAVEEHFYLIWPVVIYFLPYKRIKPVVIALLLLSIPLKLFFINNNIDINYNSFSRFDSILIGCLIAVLEKDNNYSLPNIKRSTILYALLGILFIGAIIYLFQTLIPTLKGSLKHMILGLFFGVGIFSLVSNIENGQFNKFLNHPITQYMGKISYGLYVWQYVGIVNSSLFFY
ncbi:MAG: acyltransferase [Saprospiraceae bacterium]|nr:acyltransferase [Saprospiraceae bacterium]